MKKMKFYLLLLTFILAIFSCKKESTIVPQADCELYKYGTITISNSSSNPYDIDIDGVFQVRLSGGSISSKITVYEGNNIKLHCTQVSGYILYPTEKTTYFNVVRCSDYSWQIP